MPRCLLSRCLPPAFGRCHQWYRQFVLNSNRCLIVAKWFVWLIYLYIYIMMWQMGIYWEDDWKFRTCCSNMDRERNPSHISALPENCHRDMESLTPWDFVKYKMFKSFRPGLQWTLRTCIFYRVGYSSQLCLPEGNPFLFMNHEAWDNFIWSEL